jgi:hypothetical protein
MDKLDIYFIWILYRYDAGTTRKIGFRNAYLEPVLKKQVLKGESGVFIYFIKIIRTGFV